MADNDPYAALEDLLRRNGAVQYQPGMDYSNMAFARPYMNPGSANPFNQPQGPQAGWWMVPKDVYNRISPQTSGGGFLNGGIGGVVKDVADDFKAGNLNGLGVMFGGPAAGAGITALAGPGSLASLAETAGAATTGSTAAPAAGTLGTGSTSMMNPLNMSGTGYTGNLADYGFGQSAFAPGSVVNAGGATLGGAEGGLLTGGSLTAGGMTAAGASTAASPGIFDMINKLPAAAAGLVKKFMSENPGASQNDLMNLIGKIAPAALGAFASSQQSNAYKELAEKYMSFGAPSRERFESTFRPGFTMSTDPGFTDAIDAASKSNLHALSVNGNPALSPNAQAQNLSDLYAKVSYPALQNYRTLNANAGGISSATPTAAGFDASAVGAGRGVYDAVGAGAADVFNPPKTLAQTLAELRKAGIY